jgi:hypothetical protein
MKIWAITRKNNKIVLDQIFENSEEHFEAITELINIACDEFDIGKPLMLSKNDDELLSFRRTVFYPADFIEPINFDTLEIEIIEEKEK